MNENTQEVENSEQARDVAVAIEAAAQHTIKCTQGDKEVTGETTINAYTALDALKQLAAGPCSEGEWQVELTLHAKDGAGEPMQLTEDLGELTDAINEVEKSCMPDEHVMYYINDMVQNLLRSSRIRGITVTAMLDDDKPINVSVLNKTLGDTLTQDIVQKLVYYATESVELFKSGLRKQGYEFPEDDNGGIVTA